MNINKNRYLFDTKKNYKYLTHDILQIELNLKDIYIQSYQNMRLDILSYKYYRTILYWWLIAQANNIPLDSMIYDNPGETIRIPYLGV